MKTYRVSDTTIEQLAKKQRVIIVWIVVLIYLIIAGVFASSTINAEQREIEWLITDIAIILLVGATMTFFVYKNGTRQLKKRLDNTYGKYEVDLSDDTISVRDYLMPSGITIHRSEIRALQEGASGNELVIHRIGNITSVMILNKVDGFEEIKEAISTWAPHEAKPIRIIGQGYLPLIIWCGVLVTLCPIVPLWIGLVIGIPIMLAYTYMTFPYIRNPAVKMQSRVLTADMVVLLMLVTIARMVLLIMSLTQPAS